MTTAKKSLLMLFQLAFLYVAAACVSIYAPEIFMLRKASTIILMAFSLALVMHFSEHIIDGDIRRCLVSIATLITLWIVLRGAKYIAFEETGVAARHIWYLYYIPALLIPLLSLFAALSVGKRKPDRPFWKIRLFVLFTVGLVLLVLTNDLHQLVFKFLPQFEDWDFSYTYGPFFAVIYIWITLLFIGTIYILFSRCRVSSSRRLVWIPMLPALFGVSYLTLSALDAWPRVNGQLFGQFPEAVCFTMAGIWLSLIYIGLIPANSGYGGLFEISDLAAQIADRDYRILYRSANALPLTWAQLVSGATLSLDRNTRLHRKEVNGGFVYWQDDITELNRLSEELWEAGERLSEEAELVRLENELKEERAQIEAKMRSYDEIAVRVLPQSQRIAALCAQAESVPANFSENMKEVCLLAVFIKRYANLSLLAAAHKEIETGELHLAVSESLHAVADMGIPEEAAFSGNTPLPSQGLIEAYGLFENLLERALPQLAGIQVAVQNDEMKLVLEGVSLTLPEESRAALTLEGGTSYVRIPLRKAGAPV